MTKTIVEPKIKEAIDILLEGGADMNNILGQGGLVKQFTKAILERALAAQGGMSIWAMIGMIELKGITTGMGVIIKIYSQSMAQLALRYLEIEKENLNQL